MGSQSLNVHGPAAWLTMDMGLFLHYIVIPGCEAYVTIEKSAVQAGTQKSGSQKLDWRSVPFHVIPIVLLPGKTWQGLYSLLQRT